MKIEHQWTPAKWVLSGEHGVLRQGSALVAPHPYFGIDLSYTPNQSPLQIKIHPHHPWLHVAVRQLIDTLFGPKRSELKGILALDHRIPIAYGLGFSAALCVSIAKLYKHIDNDAIDIYQVSKSLEDHFHGTSSGMDVVGVLTDELVLFKQGCYHPVLAHHWPCMTVTCSNKSSATASAIDRVQALHQIDPQKALQIDERMQQSVDFMMLGFACSDLEQAYFHWQEGLSLGLACFQDWGLVTNDVQRCMDNLMHQGALAVKPTGGGLGGAIVALWPQNQDLSIYDYQDVFVACSSKAIDSDRISS